METIPAQLRTASPAGPAPPLWVAHDGASSVVHDHPMRAASPPSPGPPPSLPAAPARACRHGDGGSSSGGHPPIGFSLPRWRRQAGGRAPPHASGRQGRRGGRERSAAPRTAAAVRAGRGGAVARPRRWLQWSKLRAARPPRPCVLRDDAVGGHQSGAGGRAGERVGGRRGGEGAPRAPSALRDVVLVAAAGGNFPSRGLRTGATAAAAPPPPPSAVVGPAHRPTASDSLRVSTLTARGAGRGRAPCGGRVAARRVDARPVVPAARPPPSPPAAAARRNGPARCSCLPHPADARRQAPRARGPAAVVAPPPPPPPSATRHPSRPAGWPVAPPAGGPTAGGQRASRARAPARLPAAARRFAWPRARDGAVSATTSTAATVSQALCEWAVPPPPPPPRPVRTAGGGDVPPQPPTPLSPFHRVTRRRRRAGPRRRGLVAGRRPRRPAGRRAAAGRRRSSASARRSRASRTRRLFRSQRRGASRSDRGRLSARPPPAVDLSGPAAAAADAALHTHKPPSSYRQPLNIRITCGNCVAHVRAKVDELSAVAESSLDLDGNLRVTWCSPPPASAADADAKVLAAIGAAGKTGAVSDAAAC
nr:PhF00005.1 [Neoporphyra haitanensis]